MLIKKNLKRSLSFFMATVFAVSTIFSTGVFLNAAAKPKLSVKKVTVTVGKTKKVTVKGVKSKQIKKTTWSIKNKKTASLSKKTKTSVTIKGVKKGSTKVTAKVKVGKKTTTLKCTVKVNAKPLPTKAPTKAPTIVPTIIPSLPPSTTPPDTTTAPPNTTTAPPDTTTAPPDTTTTPPDTTTAPPETGTPDTPNPETQAPETQTPATPKPTPDPNTTVVDFDDDEIGTAYAYTQGNTAPTVKVAADPVNPGGKTLQITTNGNNQAAVVPITLPYGLQNYESFFFNFSLVGGSSLTYKDLMVYAADNTSVFKKWGFGNDSTNANQFAANLVGSVRVMTDAENVTAAKNTWQNFKITITNPGDVIKNLQGNLYLAIGVNHDDIDFMIDDLTFRLKDSFTTPPTSTSPPFTSGPLDISSSSLVFYENFDDQNSSLYEANNPDGPILISGMSNGEAIPRIAPNNNASGLTSNNKVGRPNNSSYAARLNSYNSNDYIQVAVKNTSATKQTYLFAFCARFHTRSGTMADVPLQVVSFNANTPENKTVLKTQTILYGTAETFWNDIIVPIVDVPAGETVKIQISQTSDLGGTNCARICFDDFYLWSVNGGDPHDSANYSRTLEEGTTSELNVTLAEGETVTWSSNNTAIATVDAAGEVTAVAIGQTYVTAEIKNSEGTVVDKKVCKIDVIDKIPT